MHLPGSLELPGRSQSRGGHDALYLPYLRAPAVAHSPPPVAPVWNSSIALSPVDGAIWVANPDSGSLSVVDSHLLTKTAEIPIGQEPWSLAFDVPAGEDTQLFVLDRAAGELVVVDSTDYTVTNRLYVGPEPGGLVRTPGPNGRPNLWITLTSAASIAVVEPQTLTVKRYIPVSKHPYALAADGDNTVYVTHFVSTPRPGAAEATDDSRLGRISVLDSATLSVRHTITLTPNATGSANLLAGITLGPSKLPDYVWVPHVRMSPALPNELSTTVFAAVAAINLHAVHHQQTDDAPDVPDPVAQISLNDQEIFGSPVNNPVAAIPDPERGRLYIVLAGSNLVEVVDVADPARPRLVTFLPTGHNPRGLVLSPDGRRGYVHNYLSRSITVLDLETLDFITEVPVTGEPLATDELRGKILFHSAVDPRLSQGSWISCASCHPDGGTDGVTWIFPDGPRQTPPLWNAAATLPWHWSAALDEAQDVEETIHIIQHGLGLAPGADPALLAAPNAGRSADLDALATFLRQGIRTPNVAAPGAPSVDGASLADVAAGRQLFVEAGCAGCHGGPNWTTSALPGTPGTLDPDGNGMIDSVLLDVGTAAADDIRGATGFDVPSLLNIVLTAPYLHDGSMPDLHTLLSSGHPVLLTDDGMIDQSGMDNSRLNQEEIEQIIAFLRAIGPTTEIVELSK